MRNIRDSYNKRAAQIIMQNEAGVAVRARLRAVVQDFAELNAAYAKAGVPARIEVMEDRIDDPQAPSLTMQASGFPPLEYALTRSALTFEIGVPSDRTCVEPIFQVRYQRAWVNEQPVTTYRSDGDDLQQPIVRFVKEIETAAGGLTDAQVQAVAVALEGPVLAVSPAAEPLKQAVAMPVGIVRL